MTPRVPDPPAKARKRKDAEKEQARRTIRAARRKQKQQAKMEARQR